ncbi:DUF4123 domain-containing protein [Halomonas sp. A29]|uniref:DUF4123 domain-containing protein n=1 Tax=Halomonas sp. A29 TaxID=3102786 RepID=UPI00398AF83A
MQEPRRWEGNGKMPANHEPLYAERADELPSQWLRQCSYALLNPLTVDTDAWVDLPGEPLVTGNVNTRPHLLPQLIHLNELSAGAREALAERIEQHQRRGVAFFCALLDSRAPAERMAQHLKLHLEQRRPGDKRRWWLRFYDPYVFRHLCWQLDAEQMDRLLGPIDAWYWPDAQGHWYCRRHQSDQASDVLHLLLSRAQWARIDRLALLNRTLDALELAEPEREQDAALWRWVDTLLEQAERQPLADEDDRQCYAEQAVRFHPQIHSHPTIHARLDRVREQGISYTAACADLDDARMASLAAELAGPDRRKEAR